MISLTHIKEHYRISFKNKTLINDEMFFLRVIFHKLVLFYIKYHVIGKCSKFTRAKKSKVILATISASQTHTIKLQKKWKQQGWKCFYADRIN